MTAGAAAGIAALPPSSTEATLNLGSSSSGKEDAVALRASLADPSAPRSFAPGEVAEHFRRLSEMKRRFRRAEFGGPDKQTRAREVSRSRSREKYNSVWIRSAGRERDDEDDDR